jgi:PAS domain S-box-containing protein
MISKIRSKKPEQNEKFYRALIENSWDGILLINSKAQALYYSPSIVRLFGRDYAEFKGVNGLKYLHPADAPRIIKLLAEIILKPKATVHTEMRVRHKLGYYIWIEAVATNFLSDENIQGIIVNLHDITELKKIEERKDEFISIASHELKTPITSLKAYVQILSLGIDRISPEKKNELVIKMEGQINRLERLVSDLYDTSRISEGKISLNKEKFLLAQLIGDVVEDCERDYPSHKISINSKFRGNVIADKMRIQQVLTNLLSNAIKFSPNADKIKINIWHEKKEIYISVIDYGIGITKENISKITEKYFQAEIKYKKESGLGLGLYITYNIIKQHGGTFSIKSALEKSTVITFTLPKNKD